MIAGKIVPDYINSFSPNEYKKNDKIFISSLKAKQNVSLDFRLKKDWWQRYLLEDIKHIDLMHEKHKKEHGL